MSKEETAVEVLNVAATPGSRALIADVEMGQRPGSGSRRGDRVLPNPPTGTPTTPFVSHEDCPSGVPPFVSHGD